MNGISNEYWNKISNVQSKLAGVRKTLETRRKRKGSKHSNSRMMKSGAEKVEYQLFCDVRSFLQKCNDYIISMAKEQKDFDKYKQEQQQQQRQEKEREKEKAEIENEMKAEIEIQTKSKTRTKKGKARSKLTILKRKHETNTNTNQSSQSGSIDDSVTTGASKEMNKETSKELSVDSSDSLENRQSPQHK